MGTEAVILLVVTLVLILAISHYSAFHGGRNRGGEYVVQKLHREVAWYTTEVGHSPSVYRIVRLVTGNSTRDEVRKEAAALRKAEAARRAGSDV